MQDIFLIIITAIVILGLMPFLGKKIYGIPNKIASLIYFITSIIVTGITIVFIDMPPIETVGENLMQFLTELIHFNLIYQFSLITFIFGGFGLIGGTLELVGERVEAGEVYSDYQKSAKFKLYFFYLMYGYLFFFAVFAFTEFFILALGWTFPGEESIVRKFFKYMQYENGFLMLAGTIFFAIKTYRFGFFSMEYYKSEYDPKVANISNFRNSVKKNFAFFFGSLTIFMSFVIMIVKNYPNEAGIDLSVGNSFYFLAIVIQSSLFYGFKDKYIDQLKPLSKQYEIRVRKGKKKDETPDPFAKNKSKMEDLDDELQFD